MGRDYLVITAKQAAVLALLKEGLNQSQIAKKIGISPPAVSKLVKKLKKKASNLEGLTGGLTLTPPSQSQGVNFCPKNTPLISCGTLKNWRYHGLHFVIKPYYFFPRYKKIRKEKGNYGIEYRDWIIKLDNDMVQMQTRPLIDFADPDKWKVIRMAQDSFNRALREVSERFGFKVWKEKKANIRLVNGHLSRNPSEVANARAGEYLAIRGHDGKIWFTIDKSDGAEHEYRHPDRHLTDSEKIEPYFNDMLYDNPPKLTELSCILRELMRQNQETAAGVSAIVELLRPREVVPKKPGDRPDYIN